jgi:hypothetical protein
MTSFCYGVFLSNNKSDFDVLVDCIMADAVCQFVSRKHILNLHKK